MDSRTLATSLHSSSHFSSLKVRRLSRSSLKENGPKQSLEVSVGQKWRRPPSYSEAFRWRFLKWLKLLTEQPNENVDVVLWLDDSSLVSTWRLAQQCGATAERPVEFPSAAPCSLQLPTASLCLTLHCCWRFRLCSTGCKIDSWQTIPWIKQSSDEHTIIRSARRALFSDWFYQVGILTKQLTNRHLNISPWFHEARGGADTKRWRATCRKARSVWTRTPSSLAVYSNDWRTCKDSNLMLNDAPRKKTPTLVRIPLWIRFRHFEILSEFPIPPNNFFVLTKKVLTFWAIFLSSVSGKELSNTPASPWRDQRPRAEIYDKHFISHRNRKTSRKAFMSLM